MFVCEVCQCIYTYFVIHVKYDAYTYICTMPVAKTPVRIAMGYHHYSNYQFDHHAVTHGINLPINCSFCTNMFQIIVIVSTTSAAPHSKVPC